MIESNNSLKILDIGCGKDKFPGAVGIDKNPLSNADIIHDLDVFPYPFETNLFDIIICQSIIEHVDDVLKMVEEIHRIGKNKSMLKITVPYFTSRWAFTDPSHKHYFTTHSFDYWIKGRPLNKYHYSKCFFELIKMELTRGSGYWSRRVDTFFTKFANNHMDFYERNLSTIFHVDDIYFELRIIK